MREISFFWKRARLASIDIAPILDIISSAEFLAYIKRTPRDIRILLKTNFKPGKGPEDLNSLYFLELLDVHHTPELEDDSYVLNVRISHPLSNFNARTGGTTASPGCRLDGEGLTYIIQGGNVRLRLVAAMARLILKPDRISARNLHFGSLNPSGPLSPKQLKLAKYAYDKGWYDNNKKIRISEMAEDLKIARATLAEHLSRIETIVMDDLMGSFSNIRVLPEQYVIFKDMIEEDAEKDGYINDNNFQVLLSQIQKQIESEKIIEDDDGEKEQEED